MNSELPVFDDRGINLADPNDTLGRKLEYISIIQHLALQTYVGTGSGIALDVGCGYGRMSDALANLGYEVVGMDPSIRVLSAAMKGNPHHLWCAAKMPDLPFVDAAFDLVCLFNVARPLHLMDEVHICGSIKKLVKPGGRLAVIDNLRSGDSRYLAEKWFDETFASDGFKLIRKAAIRASRHPLIYLIRYGMVPRALFDVIARWELRRMARKSQPPRYSYYNYLFIFEKQ